MARRNYGQELWDELVSFVRVDDGLQTFPHGGDWTAHKLYFVCQYLEQTTRGMKGHPAFPDGLTYIDLFCGTGVSVVPQPSGGARRYPGSPLIASSTPKAFDRLILCDISEAAMDAVRARISTRGFAGDLHTILGDVNQNASRVAELIPHRSLNVAFVDPYSLNIHYNTIKSLSTQRTLDLIILFSDRFDLGRNVHKYYYPKEDESKLDDFLGYRTWRDDFDRLSDRSGQSVRHFFAQVYLERLAELGYSHAQSWPLLGPNGPTFRLVFASKNPLGLKYCNIALNQDFEGNRGLFRD